MDIAIVTSIDDAGRSILDVAGSIDIQSRESLIASARAGLGSGVSVLVLDLADVSFIDSTGVGALIELGHDAEDADATLVIRTPSARVARVLDMTGLANAWTIEGAVETA